MLGFQTIVSMAEAEVGHELDHPLQPGSGQGEEEAAVGQGVCRDTQGPHPAHYPRPATGAHVHLLRHPTQVHRDVHRGVANT